MGLQDALFKQGVPFESDEALEFTDATMEYISYYAILSSSQIAEEKGSYESYEGSKWSRGLLPIDTVDLLEQERGMPVEVSRTQRMDWNVVREHIRQHGMRNSNTMAIAPTATISNISGCFPLHRADLQEHLRQGQHQRRVHDRQPLPRGRSQETRPLERRDARPPEVPSTATSG